MGSDSPKCPYCNKYHSDPDRVAHLEEELEKFRDSNRWGQYLEANYVERKIGEIVAPFMRSQIELEAKVTLQQQIFDWGTATFGAGQRSDGVYAHLKREIKELGDDLNDGEELADCAILLFELAGFAGVDLLDEVDKKHKINQGRTWGDIEPDGSILHIKDGE